MENIVKNESALKTWIIICFCLIIILLQGFLAFYVIGDMGQPDWDLGVVEDLPGESPYAAYSLDNPQHVMGLKEERQFQDAFDRK